MQSILFLLAFLYSGDVISQQNVGIGTVNPDVSAQLDVVSATKGLLVPRMNMSQRNGITTPATGLLIFQTDNKPGFYYFDGVSWVALSGSLSWSIQGNTGTDTLANFIGTTDYKPFVIKIDNSRVGFLGNGGNVFWGREGGAANTDGDFNIAIGASALKDNYLDSRLIAIGDSALMNLGAPSLLGADGNIAIGSKSQFRSLQGRENTSVGNKSLYNNSVGIQNTATGSQALFSTVVGAVYSGGQNTAVGYQSLYSNSTADFNTAIGYKALYDNTSGAYNTASGMEALYYNTTGNYNVGTGKQALYFNTTGTGNTATGNLSLLWNKTGNRNTATGYRALCANTTGINNTATGDESLAFNTEGNYNIANGYLSLYSNTSGDSNTAKGISTLYFNTSGSGNTAIGFAALYHNTTGNGNTAIGNHALYSNTTGYNNTAVGNGADVAFGNLTNATAIGYQAIVNASNKVRIGDTAVNIIEGQVAFSQPSDARFKYHIRSNVPGIAFITQLRPVTYYFDARTFSNYTKTGIVNKKIIHPVSNTSDGQLRTGFLAQDVEKVARKIAYDFDGVRAPGNDLDYYSLAYSQFVIPLVEAVQQQQSIIQQQTDINKKQLKEVQMLEQKAMKSKVSSMIEHQHKTIKKQKAIDDSQKKMIENQEALIKALKSELKELIDNFK